MPVEPAERERLHLGVPGAMHAPRARTQEARARYARADPDTAALAPPAPATELTEHVDEVAQQAPPPPLFGILNAPQAPDAPADPDTAAPAAAPPAPAPERKPTQHVHFPTGLVAPTRLPTRARQAPTEFEPRERSTRLSLLAERQRHDERWQEQAQLDAGPWANRDPVTELTRSDLRKRLSAARRTNKEAREAAGLEMRAPIPGRQIENEAEMTPAELRDELEQIMDDNDTMTRCAIELGKELAIERAIERRRSPRIECIWIPFFCVISFSVGLGAYHSMFPRDCDEQQSN